MSSIERYIKSCRELSRFCSRNGWIDSSSLRITVISEAGHELVVGVCFDEVLMEGSGASPGERITCSGQLHLYLNQYGQVVRAEIL